MGKKFRYRQWLLFVLFFVIGIWGIVTAFTHEESFLVMTFLIGIVQILASLLFLKWNIFDEQ